MGNKDYNNIGYFCRNNWSSKERVAAIITCLLEHAHCDPNCATHDGQTPLDLAKEPEYLRLLLKFGATPNDNLMNKYFPQQLQEERADMSIKMFILGNPGAGKSMLVKSFKTEGDGMLVRIKRQLSKVTDVNERTVGIIPYDIQSKTLGRVTLYDFAGHREFYAGHDALLQNSMTASPSIVTLVNSGWVLQCSKSEQFFSSRFLQVLLLRLAFLFALALTDPSTTDQSYK